MIDPVYDQLGVTLYQGDCRDVLPQLPTGSVSAIVTDPPYELDFMGRAWDSTGIAYDVDMWRECLRVLAPGGHIVSFGGTRTYHRMAVAVEDAGFEIRDGLMWVYGQGFPKSLDISKAIDKAAGVVRTDRVVSGPAGNTVFQPTQRVIDAGKPVTEDAKKWDGWGTALKPAFEPIVLARKTFSGTTTANILEYDTGGLNVDAARVHGGRWPPNVLLTHNPDCGTWSGPPCEMCEGTGRDRFTHPEYGDRCRACNGHARDPMDCTPGCPVAEMDRQSGNRPGWPSSVSGGHQSQSIFGSTGNVAPGTVREGYDDDGGASRFLPTFRYGPDELDILHRFRYQAKASADGRPLVNGVGHATVKPLELGVWLVRLITPPGGLVLDPFAGSGPFLRAARDAGFPSIGIEKAAEHIPMITGRLQGRRRLGRAPDPAREVAGQGDLFSLLDTTEEEDTA